MTAASFLCERPCDQCGMLFTPVNRLNRFCSKSCSNTHSMKKYTPRSRLSHLPTGTVGAISEIIAGADLLKLGYEVFRALSPACSCDLIALRAGCPPLRIEVRTGSRSPVTGHLSFARNGGKIRPASGTGSVRVHRTESDLDHYCVVVNSGEEIVYVPPLPEAPGAAEGGGSEGEGFGA